MTELTIKLRARCMSEVGWRAVSLGLVRAFDVPQSAMGAFIGKMGHLQKQGILGVRPGKGVALTYTPDLMHKLVCACELFEFGISRTNVLFLVVECWKGYLRAICEDAAQAASHEQGPGDIIMFMPGPRLMTGGWVNSLPVIHWCSLEALSGRIERHLTKDVDFYPPGLTLTRVLATNLSERLRVFYAGVEEQLAWDAKEASRAKPLEQPSPYENQRRWQRVKRRLRTEVGEDTYERRLAHMDLIAIEGHIARLSLPTRSLKRWFESHFTKTMLQCWLDEFPTVHRMEITVRKPNASLETKRNDPRAV